MSRETARRAVDFMFACPAPHIKVEFQGGESLLNFDLVRYIVELVEERNCNEQRDVAFVLTTNLSAITRAALSFCAEHGVDISTSLDGPRDLHNANRPCVEGDSYDEAVRGIKTAQDVLGADRVAALMTATRDSLGRGREIVDEYLRHGFTSIFLRMINPYGCAENTGKNGEFAYTADEWLDFYRDTLAYILQLASEGVDFREEFTELIVRKMLSPYATGFVDLQSPAGIGIAGIVFNYDGDVYCSDEGRMLAEMGDRRFRMGSVLHDSREEIMYDGQFAETVGQTMGRVRAGLRRLRVSPLLRQRSCAALSHTGRHSGLQTHERFLPQERRGHSPCAGPLGRRPAGGRSLEKLGITRMVKLFEQTSVRYDCEPFVARVTQTVNGQPQGRESAALVVCREGYAAQCAKDLRTRLVVAEAGSGVRIAVDRPLFFPLSAEMAHLSEGDVIFCNPPTGTLSVLYRRRSPHNTIVASERCNCRCIMCPQPPRSSNAYDGDDSGWTDVCLHTIRLMSRETAALGISGGEPTMAPESLLEIVRASRDCLPRTAVQVLTNGRMFNYLSLARETASIGHPDLIFGVPVYSDLADEHDRIVGARGAFDQTIRGIMNLRRCGLRVEIRTVAMRPNFERLPGLARFIARNLPFAEHVALMGMEPVGLARRNIERLWIDPADYQSQLVAAVAELRRYRMAVSIFNEQLCVLHPSIRDVAARSISDWKNVYVDECLGCTLQNECGGFFESSRELYSRAIRALDGPLDLYG